MILFTFLNFVSLFEYAYIGVKVSGLNIQNFQILGNIGLRRLTFVLHSAWLFLSDVVKVLLQPCSATVVWL